jgi:hypothetical protein
MVNNCTGIDPGPQTNLSHYYGLEPSPRSFKTKFNTFVFHDRVNPY